MEPTRVLKWLIKSSGMTYGKVSRALDKSPQWARNASIGASTPQLSTVADIADVCNVDVAFIDRDTGETLGVVDPPHRVKREG